MKRMASLILAVLAVLCVIGVPAMAVDGSQHYSFELNADGKDTLTVNPGDVITVYLTLECTDSDEPCTIYAMQDEIRYDSSFFELVEGGTLLNTGVNSTDIARRGGFREFYMNFLSLSGGTLWSSRTSVGSFQLRVTAQSGASKITNQDYRVSLPDGSDSYACTANEITVIVTTDCTVHFEVGGGIELSDLIITYGEKLTRPEDPVREGYIFEGWYHDIDLTEPWDFDNDVVAGNMTLYAKWTPVAAGTGTTEPEDGAAELEDEPQKEKGGTPWYVFAAGIAGAGVLALGIAKLIQAIAAAAAAKAAAAGAGALAFNAPNLDKKIVLTCLEDTPGNVEFQQLLGKRKFVDLKVIPYSEKATVIERAEKDNADLVILSSRGTEPELCATVANIKENDSNTLLGIVAETELAKTGLEALAIKPSVADAADSASRKLAKLLTQLYKTELTLENGAQIVGELAEALGIPLVSTVVGVFLAGKDVAEVVADKEADGIDAANITADIAEIFGFSKLEKAARTVIKTSVKRQRSSDARKNKELLNNNPENRK